ncbi:MAG: TetR/AcrR family transcriptional regulator [Verrucomicrobiota bacterium]
MSKKKTSAKKAGKREKKKDKTKKAILKAALDSFAKKGFHRTTTKEISERAGIAEGTLFNYFAAKEDLALFFIEQEVSGLISWYESEQEIQDAPVAEKLFAIMHRYLESVSPYEDFVEAVYLRALHPSSKLNPLSLDGQEVNLQYLQFIRGILREAEAAGEIPAFGDFGAYGFGLFQLGILTHWLQDKSENKEDTLALLDRCLNIASAVIRNGGWEW